MWSLLTAVETSDELLKPERNHSLYVTYSVPSIPSISIRFRGQSAGSQRQGDIFCLSFGLRVPGPLFMLFIPVHPVVVLYLDRASSLQSSCIDAGTKSVGAVLTRIARSGPEVEKDRGAWE